MAQVAKTARQVPKTRPFCTTLNPDLRTVDQPPLSWTHEQIWFRMKAKDQAVNLLTKSWARCRIAKMATSLQKKNRTRMRSRVICPSKRPRKSAQNFSMSKFVTSTCSARSRTRILAGDCEKASAKALSSRPVWRQTGSWKRNFSFLNSSNWKMHRVTRPFLNGQFCFRLL